MKKIIMIVSACIILIIGGMFFYKVYKSYRSSVAGQKLKQQIRNINEAYKDEQFKDAIEKLKKIYPKIKGTKYEPSIISLYGRLYLNLSEWDEASKQFLKILDMDCSAQYKTEALYSLGSISENNGEFNIAKNYYKRIIEEFPESDFVDDAWFRLSGIYQKEGKLIESRKILEQLRERYTDSNLIESVINALYYLNIKILFSPVIDEWSTEYTVEKGDSLNAIAKKQHTTVELLKECNNIEGIMIHPGDKLKVVNTDFTIMLDKQRNTLTLKADEKVVKVYNVGTGKENTTPVGSFTIVNKIVNPPWFKKGKGIVPYGDSENILGTRWMGFDKTGFGIHGTWDNDSIGKHESAGCVRMRNEEVEELFKIVSVGTSVVITE